MGSFQTERQLANARKFLPFKKILHSSGRLNLGEILNTLIQQTILVMKQNKHFRALTHEDQSELCETNVMVCIAPPTTFGLQQILPLVDPEIRDEITRLATFLDTFSKLEIPRCAANLMIFIAMFSSEFCDLEDRDAVTEARTSYIQLLYECLCQTIGVRKSCTVASKLHVMMQNLDRICQIL